MQRVNSKILKFVEEVDAKIDKLMIFMIEWLHLIKILRKGDIEEPLKMKIDKIQDEIIPEKLDEGKKLV